jgi:hypothetical protein
VCRNPSGIQNTDVPSLAVNLTGGIGYLLQQFSVCNDTGPDPGAHGQVRQAGDAVNIAVIP